MARSQKVKRSSKVEPSLPLDDGDDESGLSAYEKAACAKAKYEQEMSDVEVIADLSLSTPITKKTKKSYAAVVKEPTSPSASKIKPKASPRKRVVKSAEVIELSSNGDKDDPDAALLPGDSMFPGKRKSRIVSDKIANNPSPVKTRSASGIVTKRVLENQTSDLSGLSDNDERLHVAAVRLQPPIKSKASDTKTLQASSKRQIIESESSEDEPVHASLPVRDLRSPKKKARPAPPSPSDADVDMKSDVHDASSVNTHLKSTHDAVMSQERSYSSKSDDDLPLSPSKPPRDTTIRNSAVSMDGLPLQSKAKSSRHSKPARASDIFDDNEVDAGVDLDDEDIVIADSEVVFPGQTPPSTPVKDKGKRKASDSRAFYKDAPKEFVDFPDIPRAMMLSREDREAVEEAQTKRLLQRTRAERDSLDDSQTRRLLAGTRHLVEPLSPGAVIAQCEPGSTKTFGDMVKSAPKLVATHPSMFLQDVSGNRVKSLPDTCQVSDIKLQDPFLVDTYVGLPNLTSGIITSWNDAFGPGQIIFTAWGAQCERMIFDVALMCLIFKRAGCYINPSRASPLDAYSVHTVADGSRSVLYTGKSMAILISSVFTVSSYLLNTPEKGLAQHFISGIFHSQEWERFCGFMCMVFGYPELTAQLSLDALSFSSKAAAKAGNRNPKSPGPSTMFSKVDSPSTKRGNQSNPSKAGPVTRQVLEFTDTIPVYDGRGKSLDLDKDIERLQDILPLFDGEVPQGSFAVVAYSASTYKGAKKNQINLSCNVQWVLVLGTPE